MGNKVKGESYLVGMRLFFPFLPSFLPSSLPPSLPPSLPSFLPSFLPFGDKSVYTAPACPKLKDQDVLELRDQPVSASYMLR
jgi:hypothetical protein